MSPMPAGWFAHGGGSHLGASDAQVTSPSWKKKRFAEKIIDQGNKSGQSQNLL
jgi:hypothetical protein